jgi:hypothetical protein
LCGRKGHLVTDCWHRFDENYVADDNKYAGATTTSYGVDSNWYTNTGATDHVTGKLEKLTVSDKYKRNDQVHTANGAGMNASHIGYSIVKTPHQNLRLRNVLYVFEANKNLVSVHKLHVDNFVFLEYHPNYFVIKDRDTRKPLLKGCCHKGLYPLPLESLELAFGVFKPSLARWHNHLGHPSIPIAKELSTSLIYLVLVSQIRSLCVMYAREPRVINFLTPSQIIVRVIL